MDEPVDPPMPTCDCGRSGRIDGHTFEQGCEAWTDDMAEPPPACREGHREAPCVVCWSADPADRCPAGRLAYGDPERVGVLAATYADYQGWRLDAQRAGLDPERSVWLCQPSDTDPMPVGFTLYLLPTWDALLSEEGAIDRINDLNRRAPVWHLWMGAP